ncbi:MAG: ferritin family protein [bacterium]|jgi:rubrerythrin|nr:ferritin family protein [bacterium]
MTAFANVEEALNFAIKREIEAARFYTQLAARMQRREMKEALLEMAEEEKGHRDRLITVRDGGGFQARPRELRDLKVADYVDMPEITADLDWAQALIVAMKREAAARDLYLELARLSPDEAIRSVFERLAEEEGLHKRRFEAEYEERVLEGN